MLYLVCHPLVHLAHSQILLFRRLSDFVTVSLSGSNILLQNHHIFFRKIAIWPSKQTYKFQIQNCFSSWVLPCVFRNSRWPSQRFIWRIGSIWFWCMNKKGLAFDPRCFCCNFTCFNMCGWNTNRTCWIPLNFNS